MQSVSSLSYGTIQAASSVVGVDSDSELKLQNVDVSKSKTRKKKKRSRDQVEEPSIPSSSKANKPASDSLSNGSNKKRRPACLNPK